LDHLALSSDPHDRQEVASALLDLATVDGSAVPPDLATRLAEDPDDLVAKKGQEVVAAISSLPEKAYANRFGQFGI
jgi:hypothetical protein